MPSKYRDKKPLGATLGEHMRSKAPQLAAVPTANGSAPTLGGTLHPSVVTITPEIAARWLERNHPSNRPIAWRRVEAFANDMRNGDWKLTHQAVAFDKDGTLLDGQHRLQAVVASGCSVRMLIVRNDDGAFHDPIDRGAGRTLSLLTGLNSRIVGALALIRMLEQGFHSAVPMTVAEAEDAYERHKDSFDKLYEYAPALHKLHSGTIAACVWALPTGEQKVCAWARQVISGEMIKRGDPAFAFRSWKERNPRISGWETAMAAFACIRHAMHEKSIANVHTGDYAYRSVTSRRRALRIKNTPGVDVVATGHWGISPNDKGDV